MQRPEVRLQKSVNELLEGILFCDDQNISIPALILYSRSRESRTLGRPPVFVGGVPLFPLFLWIVHHRSPPHPSRISRFSAS